MKTYLVHKIIGSHHAPSIGTVLNEVKYTYADSNWGQITEIQQNNTTSVGGSGTREIDYAYADGAVSGAAKYLRRTSVTYPGPSTRTVVYYNYPSSGDGAVLSRLDNIAADGSGTTKYASYTYLGASTISKLNHPAVTNDLVLDYDPSANGTFSAWDQFGQITDQKWKNNGSAIDEYGYGYDYNGNRKYRQNSGPSASSLDEAYSYDNLDRVSDLQRGTLSGTTITGTPAREQAFSLDELGNWTEYLTKTSGTTDQDQTRGHNAVNETGTITHVTGSVTWVSPTYDTNGNMTAGPQPGSEASTLNFVYDAWNRMVKVTDNAGPVRQSRRRLYEASGSGLVESFGLGPGHYASGILASSAGGDFEGLAFDHAGNLFISDAAHNQILKLDAAGTLSVFADTALSQPHGVAFDRQGNLYVANTGDNTIEIFSPAGVPSLFTSQNLSLPTGVAFDSSGNLFVTNQFFGDQGSSSIEMFAPDGTGSLFASTPDVSDFSNIAIYPGALAVPEPATLAFLGFGLAAITRCRRNRHRLSP